MVVVEAYYGLIKLPTGAPQDVWPCSGAWSQCCPNTIFPVAAPFLGGMAFFILRNFCVKLDRACHLPKNAIVAWFGRVGIFSYSLYLVHSPIRAILKQLLRPYSYTQNPVLFLVVGAVLGSSRQAVRSRQT
jgi:peptidoglycan/LPS O-acetylase OafA/YrhL